MCVPRAPVPPVSISGFVKKFTKRLARPSSPLFSMASAARALTLSSPGTYTARVGRLPQEIPMRLTPWLRAAVAPALAVTAALVCTPPTDTSAQAGSQEQTLYVSAVDKNGAPVEG